MTTHTRQRVFVYDRREVFLLSAVVLLVALFTFTLGVHFGKQIVFRSAPVPGLDASSADTVPDSIPNRQELQEQAKGLVDAADEIVAQELQDEVKREGLKLEHARQVELPKQAHSKNAGATTLRSQGRSRAGFSIQIGSHPTLKEAEDAMKPLESQGLKPFLKEAEIKGKGTWYRVYLGNFDSQDAGQKAGQNYRDKGWIKSYIVTKTP